MKPVCEVAVSHILPEVRAIITRELLFKYKLTQQETAELLGITQAAVSHYSRQIRGSKIKIKEKDILEKIDLLAKEIFDKKLSPKQLNAKFCYICREVRKRNLVCKPHRDIYPLIGPCDECQSC